jgi:hypothetical protein
MLVFRVLRQFSHRISSVILDHLPKDVTYEGVFEIDGQLQPYAITETVRRGNVQLERDELAALALRTMQASDCPAPRAASLISFHRRAAIAVRTGFCLQI